MRVMKLEKKDKDILFELSLNARATITKISKKVKLSKQVVSYRLNLLEQRKVILGYHAITNPYALNLTHYRVFVKYNNMSSEKESEFMKYLEKHKQVTWTAYFDGKYDAAFIIWTKNIMEFQNILDNINEIYGRYFQEKYFSITTKIEYLKYKFLNNKRSIDSIYIGDEIKKNKLDELDKKLLLELNKNGRATLVELANRYDSSAKVINERIKKLIKRDIIVGFNIKIDHKKIGFSHRKIMFKLNDTSKKTIKKISDYFRILINTIYIIRPIGDYDLEVELMTKSNQEFHDLIKNLRTRFAKEIKSYDTAIHYSEPKSGQLFKIN
jgi:DNA-binding Lrp family transcriptional regulator